MALTLELLVSELAGTFQGDNHLSEEFLFCGIALGVEFHVEALP